MIAAWILIILVIVLILGVIAKSSFGENWAKEIPWSTYPVRLLFGILIVVFVLTLLGTLVIMTAS